MRLGLVGLVFGLGLPLQASAQLAFEQIGSRALGMAGAFVAVADDATAVYWNPAGLVTGGPVGMTVEWNRLQIGKPEGPLVPGFGRTASTLSSVVSWPLGVSYGHFRDTVVSPAGTPGGPATVRTLDTRHFGATILQSVVEGLVVGATLRLVRGGVVTTPAELPSLGAALDASEGLARRARTAFDLDVGILADLHRVRVGLTLRNLATPEFGDEQQTMHAVPRRVRLGVAVLPVDGLTLAMDLDLDTADPTDGLRRMIALGGESRLGRRLAVRGGVRFSRDGARRPVSAVGASLLVRRGTWLDGYLAVGRDDEARGFGVALRAGS
jgi:hypothetical protein